MFINKVYDIDRASKKSFECDMYKEHNDILPVFWSHVYPSLLACSSEKTDSNDTTAEILYETPYIDRDGDGMSEEEGDCDESDPWTFLGASDAWYDGIDSDCAGNDDYDQDGDGFVSVDYEAFSDLPSGDCDDQNALIYPLAEDISVNNIDENCDGFDGIDADEDGFADFFSGGTDCDDLEPSVVEIWKENLFHDEHLNGEIDFHIQKNLVYNAEHQKVLKRIRTIHCIVQHMSTSMYIYTMSSVF